MNTNVKVIGLTRLGIKQESTAQETDAPYHSEPIFYYRDINDGNISVKPKLLNIIPL